MHSTLFTLVRSAVAPIATTALLLASAALPAVAQSSEDDSLVSTALFPARHTAFNGRAYFAADDGAHGTELWVSNGTAAGTFMLRDINTGTGDSNPDYLTVVGNKLFFSADNGQGAELWTTDGTAAGTIMVKNVNGSSASSPRFLTAVGNRVYFAATESATGIEPWVSDGTSAGTHIVADVYPGSMSSGPLYFTEANGTVFFSAQSATTSGKGKRKVTVSTGVELWKSNGTAAGTSLVKDIVPGSNHSLPRDLFAFNGVLYFSAGSSNIGFELMRSDGTAAGTFAVKDLRTGSLSSNPRGFRVHAGVLYFNANGSTGNSLWQTDGTAAGTIPATLAQGIAGFVGADFAVIGSRFIFRSEGLNGLELVSRDGAATSSLFILNPVDGFPEAFLGVVLLGDRLLFTALTHELGFDLYSTDGTVAGTTLVRDFQPGSHSVPEPLFIESFGNKVLLSAADSPSGHELWVSDGTPAGTSIVTDIQPD